jgi:hypothetical protein
MFTLQSGQCHLRIRVGLLHPMVGRRVLTGRSERKRSQDKIYPKGYVEMLEQQQAQLVSGLKEMYQRLQKASAWEGPSLDETSGHPLTHDILSALNLLESKHDDSGEPETFEENCDKLQSKMVSEGANYVRRRGSISSESEHSLVERPKIMPSRNETPAQPKPPIFKENFSFSSAGTSPLTQSPVPRSQPQYAAPSPAQILPLQEYAFINDPPIYANNWQQAVENKTYPGHPWDAKQNMPATDHSSYPSWQEMNAPMELAQLPFLCPAWQSQQRQMMNVNPSWSQPEVKDGMEVDFESYVAFLEAP